MFDYWLVKASTEIQLKNTDGLSNVGQGTNNATKLVRSKAFARYALPLTELFYMTCSADAGMVWQMGGQKGGVAGGRVKEAV